MFMKEPLPVRQIASSQSADQQVRSRWLTMAEACSYVQLHPVTLRRAVRRGNLVAFRVNRGRVYRFRCADLDNYIESGQAVSEARVSFL
jgi:excisionase family DNA binding protein